MIRTFAFSFLLCASTSTIVEQHASMSNNILRRLLCPDQRHCLGRAVA
jgi:hypothetical protein